jgi:hypothetical protein
LATLRNLCGAPHNFRIEDFYELFGEDAETAHKLLGLTLTTRDQTLTMAGSAQFTGLVKDFTLPERLPDLSDARQPLHASVHLGLEGAWARAAS